MPNHTEYPTLFDIHPLGTEPPVAQRPITSGSLLPLPVNQVIDIARAAAILNLQPEAVVKLRNAGEISGFRHDESKRWFIHYASIVDFCDRLRIKFAIADRRPKLPLGRRWRDADILPFPKSDTVTVEDAMRGLDMYRNRVLDLIEAGKFESYQLAARMPWRISKTSLFQYAETLKAQLEVPRKLAR